MIYLKMEFFQRIPLHTNRILRDWRIIYAIRIRYKKYKKKESGIRNRFISGYN